MNSFKVKSILLLAFVFLSISVIGQDDGINKCNQYLTPGFVPFENAMVMEINNDETAIFHLTFYDEFIYRIIACSDIEDSDFEFAVYDQEKNLLYTNRDYDYSPYWDFIFNSTLDCTIKVEPVKDDINEAIVKLLIGYKLKKK